MPPRCEKGTRRNKKTGNCEPHTKTKKNRKSMTPPATKPIRKIKRAISNKPDYSNQRLTDERLKNELTNIIKELEEELKEIKDDKTKFTKEQRQESLKYKKILDTHHTTNVEKDAHTIKTIEALNHSKPELRMRDLDAAIATLKNHRKNKNFEFVRQLAM